MKKFFKEFKEFISRGSVLDLAVGVIIGGAFTAIVTALTNYILRPIINWIIWLCCGGKSVAAYTFLHKVTDAEGVIDMSASIYIDWGAFISAIINFLLIAFVLFVIIKAINNMSSATKQFKESNKKKKTKIKEFKKQGMTTEQAKAAYQEYLAEEQAELEKKAAEQAAAEEEAKKHTTEALLEDIKALLQEQNKNKE